MIVGFASCMALLVSCVEPTAPTAGAGASAGALASTGTGAPSLLACPSNTASTAQATIGLLGGMVEAAGTRIAIPPGAVLLPHVFTVTVPASRLMEVQITAEGYEHFDFLLPVQVTIDYSRCRGNPAVLSTLSAYHIDEQTKGLLELMRGADDKFAHAYTFTTDHLSGYAIAN